METLTFAGKEYVKAKSAARELGYTPDYIGQLCRAGKIDARLVGRSWYVDIEELENHKKLKYGKKNTKTIKDRSVPSPGSRRDSAEDRFGSEMNYYAHAKQPAAYETDQEALLPPIQKKGKANDFDQTLPQTDDDVSEEQVAVDHEADQSDYSETEESHKINVIDATVEPTTPAETSAVAEPTTSEPVKTLRQRNTTRDYSERDDTVQPPKRAPSSPDNRYIRRHQHAQKNTATYTKGSTAPSTLSLTPYVLTAAISAAVVLVLVLGVQIEITSTAAQTSEQFGFSMRHFLNKEGF